MKYTLPSAFSKRDPAPGLAVAMGDRLALPTLSAGLTVEDGDDWVIRARITTPDMDRDGDELVPEGCRKWLPRYLRNPIVCWNHDRDAIPIGTDLGGWQITPEGIVARARLSKTDQRSREVYKAIQEGRLRAVSVSFIPHRSEPLRDGRYRITEWEPLEWGPVPIPANALAGVLPPGKSIAHHGAILKSLGMSEGEGSGGGFMADDDKQKPESADKKFCKAMKKAIDDHEPVSENPEVKKFCAGAKKLGGKHFKKAYEDEDWGWEEQQEDAEAQEGDTPDDGDEISDEEQKAFEDMDREFYGLTGRHI